MSQLHTIPEAIEAIQRGEIIIVVDDEDRENEGDFLIAARHASPEVVNFMATHGRGLICAPMLESRCDELGLDLMVQSNNAAFETPFTVSVDLMGHGCTTGISASDRSKTIQALIDPATPPDALGKPGHIFPLRAKPGGVLRRPGHTEAAVDFARLAGFEPAGVIVEIMNEDGSMARLPELVKLAEQHNMKLVSIADLIEHRLAHESLIERTAEVSLNTSFGQFKAISFRQTTNEVDHLALVMGEWNPEDAVPVRVHASSMVGDIFQIQDFGKGSAIACRSSAHSERRQRGDRLLEQDASRRWACGRTDGLCQHCGGKNGRSLPQTGLQGQGHWRANIAEPAGDEHVVAVRLTPCQRRGRLRPCDSRSRGPDLKGFELIAHKKGLQLQAFFG